MTETLSPAKSKRLISLDALRGFTIAALIMYRKKIFIKV